MIFLIVFFLCFAILTNILRHYLKFKCFDWLYIASIFVVTIIYYELYDFAVAVFAFFIGGIGLFITGLTHKESRYIKGRNYTFKCSRCGYNHLKVEILNDSAVKTVCKRCGQVDGGILQ